MCIYMQIMQHPQSKGQLWGRAKEQSYRLILLWRACFHTVWGLFDQVMAVSSTLYQSVFHRNSDNFDNFRLMYLVVLYYIYIHTHIYVYIKKSTIHLIKCLCVSCHLRSPGNASCRPRSRPCGGSPGSCAAAGLSLSPAASDSTPNSFCCSPKISH